MKKRVPVILLTMLALSSCTGSPDSTNQTADIGQSSITVTDDLDRQVTVAPPKRVAAMIGSFADIWCLAGGKDTLIAAANETWTNFDLGLSEDVINLGSVKTPSLEPLLAAEPDLILASCNTSSNLQLMDTFEEADIPVLYFDVEAFDDYLRMLDICTQLTGCPENMELYGYAVKERADAAIARQTKDAPTVLYIRASGSGCTVKGSTGNVLGEMLADLGCINIADSDQSLLENLSLETILAANPDYIFAVLQGSDKDQAQSVLEQTLLSNPAWKTLDAVASGNFYTLDHTLYNLKPNARWGEAYEKLADILYPEQNE